MDSPTLAAEFPAATRDAWLTLVEAALKGQRFERLVSRTYDGLSIQPLYAKGEGAAQPLRAEQGRWAVSQRVDHPDPAEAAQLALADLEGGADALTLVFAGARAGRGFGLRAAGVDDLDRALAGVMLDLVQVRIDAGAEGRRAAELVAGLAERRGHDLGQLRLDLGLDPLGQYAVTGEFEPGWAGKAAGLLHDLRGRGFRGHAFMADGRPAHEAGGAEAQELAFVLANAVALLRALEAGGHPLDEARDAIAVLLVADADEILTIAKVRAMRRLWASLEQACGLDPKPLRLHAETAWRMTTRRDPWVNLLRGTVAAFSAGLGGADAVTVLPFTAALGLPDAFARRLARNTQLILLEEANLWRVADPAAGAGGFEALTAALAEQAWALFQEIEREGGLVDSLKAGGVQARLAATRAERERAIARRRDPLTGVSEFPDIREAPVQVLAPAPADGAEPARGLPSLRSAEPFERLRDRSDEALARTGRRPRIFLANLGPIAAFTARATFAKNFFEAGGIEALTNDGFASPEAVADAFKASGARLACLCSSDEVYAEQALPAAAALREAGAVRLFVAGRPSEAAERLREAGVTGYIHVGCEALATLEDLHAALA